MPPRAHAKLSPSASHRWLHCPAAPRLEAPFPDTTSYDAALGTAVHDIGERALQVYKKTGDLEACDPGHQLGREVVVAGWDEPFTVDEEMVEGARVYVVTVVSELKRLGLGPDALQVEHRFRLDQIRKGMGGTADAVIRQPWGELVVIDYKNGTGYVEVERNPQLMQYGLGAAYDAKQKEYDPYETVKLIVVQPRCWGEEIVRSWEIDADELIAWGDGELKEGAKKASSKRSKPVAGEWCRWCKARGQCGALLDKNVSTAMTVFSPVDETKQPMAPPPAVETIPIDKMGLVLEAAEIIADWVKQVQHRVDALLAAGEVTPEQIGWKRVWGRSNNKWSDNVEDLVAAKASELGVDPYTKQLLSYAQLRDAIAAELEGSYKTKKAAKERAKTILADYITTNRGTSLVPITDKREAIQPAITAFTLAGEE